MLRIALLFCALLLAGCAPTPRQLGFSDQKWNAFSKAEQADIQAGYHEVGQHGVKVSVEHAGPDLRVDVADGTAMMPPFTEAHRFQTTPFSIQAGQCISTRLRSVESPEQVSMKACYDGLTLSLDPSPYRLEGRIGTVYFNYTPVWTRGFTYRNVNTTGYVQLHDATVTVETLTGTAASVQAAGEADHG